MNLCGHDDTDATPIEKDEEGEFQTHSQKFLEEEGERIIINKEIALDFKARGSTPEFFKDANGRNINLCCAALASAVSDKCKEVLNDGEAKDEEGT